MATKEKTNDATTTKTTGMLREMSDTRRILTLVGGDLLCFLIFATLGRGSHGEATGLAAIPEVIVTAAPFAIAWFLVAPFVGAFGRDVVNRPRTMSKRTLIAWVIAWPVSLLLRWLFVGHAPPVSFAIIVFAFNLGILLVWRWPFALNNSLRRSA
jgi:Protein of unknown function (DUF3054)